MKNRKLILGLLAAVLSITAVSSSTLAKSNTDTTSARWTEGTGPSLYEKPYRPSTVAIYTQSYCSEMDDALLLTQVESSSKDRVVNTGITVSNNAGLPAPSPKKQIVSYTNEGQVRETQGTPLVMNNIVVAQSEAVKEEKATASTSVQSTKYPAIEETTEEVLKPTGTLEYKGSWVEKNSKWFWRDAEGEDHTGTVTVNGTVYEIPPTGLDIKPC